MLTNMSAGILLACFTLSSKETKSSVVLVYLNSNNGYLSADLSRYGFKDKTCSASFTP